VAEREDISRGIASGSSIREIARGLDRAASSVCPEVARHGGRPAYRAHDADQQAWVSALRPKSCLLAENRKLRDIVASRLILDWSPEQISGWLKNQYPNDESLRVSRPPAAPNVTLLDRRKPKPHPSSHANTTFTEQIYIRWCCIDLSNAPDLSGI